MNSYLVTQQYFLLKTARFRNTLKGAFSDHILGEFYLLDRKRVVLNSSRFDNNEEEKIGFNRVRNMLSTISEIQK